MCVQDEAICVADARLRKGIYTPKRVRGVYTYTGSHSKTIVFGLITVNPDVLTLPLDLAEVRVESYSSGKL